MIDKRDNFVDFDERREKSICVFRGTQTAQELTRAVAVLAKTFKNQIDNDFIDILLERMIEKQMPDILIREAINYVVDNCKYPPKIADILSFGRVKLYNYFEYCNECSNGNSDDMYCVKKGKRALWVKYSECAKYSINPEILKQSL